MYCTTRAAVATFSSLNLYQHAQRQDALLGLALLENQQSNEMNSKRRRQEEKNERTKGKKPACEIKCR